MFKHSQHFIGFNEEDGNGKKWERRSARKDWQAQQKFYRENKWNCETEIKCCKDVGGQEHGRSARLVRYRVEDGSLDRFMSDMHLGFKL